MWLPREARVGVAPAISKHSRRKTKIPGAPPLLCKKRKEENTESDANNKKKLEKVGEGVAVGDSEPNETGFTDILNAGNRSVDSQNAVRLCSESFSTNIDLTTAMKMKTPKYQMQSMNAPPAATICEWKLRYLSFAMYVKKSGPAGCAAGSLSCSLGSS